MNTFYVTFFIVHMAPIPRQKDWSSSTVIALNYERTIDFDDRFSRLISFIASRFISESENK